MTNKDNLSAVSHFVIVFVFFNNEKKGLHFREQSDLTLWIQTKTQIFQYTVLLSSFCEK